MTATLDDTDTATEGATGSPGLLPEDDSGVDVQTSTGALAILPGQEEWTREQREVLAAVGVPIDVPPAYMKAFLHLCLLRGLDPFAGEATVMRTEDGWVPIIKIDGLRSMAAKSGEYEGTTDPEWCDEDGRWYTAYPRAKGRPFGARRGVYRTGLRDAVTSVVYTEEVEATEAIYEIDARGHGIFKGWELARRWRDGEGVRGMIVKCAEAAALRVAFPRETDGFYTPEEMDRVRARGAADRLAVQQAAGREARRVALAAVTAPGESDPVEGEVTHHQGEPVDTMAAVQRLRDRAQETRPTDDVKVSVEAPLAVEVVTSALLPLTAAERVAALQEEIAEQAAILGVERAVLTARFAVLAANRPVEEWDEEALLRCASTLRKSVSARLRADGRYDEARAYSEVVGRPVVDWPRVLFGRATQ